MILTYKYLWTWKLLWWFQSQYLYGTSKLIDHYDTFENVSISKPGWKSDRSWLLLLFYCFESCLKILHATQFSLLSSSSSWKRFPGFTEASLNFHIMTTSSKNTFTFKFKSILTLCKYSISRGNNTIRINFLRKWRVDLSAFPHLLRYNKARFWFLNFWDKNLNKYSYNKYGYYLKILLN